MKNIKLPPKAIREYVEFKNGDVLVLPNMPPKLMAQFYMYKLE